MTRRNLSRGGLAAALVALALYVLLGGDIDLGGDSSSGPDTQTEPVPTQTEPAPTDTSAEAPPNGGRDGGTDIPAEERREITRVLALVDTGGPFPHDQDGTTFQNREGHLPQQPNDYYREYTVETPGSPDRGARRLVIGEGGEIYYTRDHYDSFVQIDREEFR